MSTNIDESIVRVKFENEGFDKKIEDSIESINKFKDSLNLEKSADSLKGIQKQVDQMDFTKLMNNVEELNKKFSVTGIAAQEVIRRVSNSAMNAVSNVYKSTLGKIGPTAIWNQIMTGGKSRALKLEHANFMLEGIYKNTEKVEAALKSANDAVTGTAYGLDAAANAAAQFAASGMEGGDEMTSALKGISGVASMTSSEFEDIARIFTTVSGNGRLMGDQLLQLSGRGINAAAAITDFFNGVRDGSIDLKDANSEISEANEELIKSIKTLDGVSASAKLTEENVRDMVSKGKINFKMFYTAMDQAYGKQATKANETYTGAISNLKAAFSRIGAKFWTPMLTNIRDLANAARPLVNAINNAITPFINLINAATQAGTTFIVNVLERMTSAVEKLAKPMSNFTTLFDSILENTSDTIKDAEGNVVGRVNSYWKALTSAFSQRDKIKEATEYMAEHADDKTLTFAKALEAVGASFTAAGDDAEKAGTQIEETLVGIGATSEKTGEALTESFTAAKEAIENILSSENKYGNGDERIANLDNAGFNGQKIQDAVNLVVKSGYSIEDALKEVGYTAEETGEKIDEALNGVEESSEEAEKKVTASSDKIKKAVEEIWKGNLGSGDERRALLESDKWGLDPDKVQEVVNYMDKYKVSVEEAMEAVGYTVEETGTQIEETLVGVGATTQAEGATITENAKTINESFVAIGDDLKNLDFRGAFDEFRNFTVPAGIERLKEIAETVAKVFGIELPRSTERSLDPLEDLGDTVEGVSDKTQFLGKPLVFVTQHLENLGISTKETGKPLEFLAKQLGDLTGPSETSGEALNVLANNMDSTGGSSESLLTKLISFVTKLRERLSSIRSSIAEFGKNIWNLDFDAAGKQIKDGFKILQTITISKVGKLKNKLGKVGEKMKDVWADIVSFNHKSLGNRLKTGITSIWTIIKTKFSSVSGGLKSFKDNTTSGFQSFITSIKDKFKDSKSAIGQFIYNTVSALGNFGDSVKHKFNAIALFLKPIVTRIKSIFKGISNVFKGFTDYVSENFGDLLLFLQELNFARSLFKITTAISNFGKVFKSVSKVIKRFSQTIKAYNKQLKAAARKDNATALLYVAGALGILAASLWVLSNIPTEKLVKAGVALVILGAALLAFMYVYQKISGASGNKITKNQNKFSDFLEQLKDGFKDFGKAAKYLALAILIMTIVAALALMIVVIKAYANLFEDDEIKKGGQRVAQVLIALAGSIAAMGWACKGSGAFNTIGIAAVILALVHALKEMVDVIKEYAAIPIETLGPGLLKVVAIIGGLVAAVAALSYVSQNANFGQLFGVALVLLSLSVTLIAIGGVLKELVVQPWEQIAAAGLVMIGVLIAIGFAIYLATKNGCTIRTAITLLAMAVVVVAIGATLVALTFFASEKMIDAAVALGGVLLAIGGAIALSNMNGGSLANAITWLSITVIVVAVAVALVVLSTLPMESVAMATGALVSVFGSIALVLYTANNLTGFGTAGLIICTVAIGLIGYVIFKLNEMEGGADAALKIALALTTVMLSLSLFMAVSALVEPNGLLGMGFAMLAVVIVASLIWSLNNDIEDPEHAQAVTNVLTDVINSMALLLAAAGFAGLSGVNGIINLVGGVLAVAALIFALHKIGPKAEEVIRETMPSLEAFGDAVGSFFGHIVDSFLEAAGFDLQGIANTLCEFMDAIQPFIEKAEQMNGLNGATQGCLLVGEACLAFLGGNFLAAIGGAIGDLLGTDIVGAAKKMTQFMDEIQPFLEASEELPSEAVETAGYDLLADSMWAFTKANIAGAVGSIIDNLIENPISNAAAEMSKFMEEIQGFIDALDDLPSEEVSTEGFTFVKKAMWAFTGANLIGVLGGIIDSITESSISDVASTMSEFMENIQGFLDGIEDMPSEEVRTDGFKFLKDAVVAFNEASFLTLFSDLLTTITDTTFSSIATEMSTFMGNIQGFLEGAKGIDESATNGITFMTEALEKFGEAKFKTALSDVKSGILEGIFGESDTLADFGTDLTKLGGYLKQYADSVSGVDLTSAEKATKLAESLSALKAALPSDGGWFSGNKTLESFGEDLVKFGEKLSDYGGKITNIDTEKLTTVATAVGDMVQILNNANSDESNLDISNITGALSDLAELSIDEYLEGFESPEDTHITSAINALVQKLCTALDDKKSDYETPGENVITSFITGMANKISALQTIGKAVADTVIKAITDNTSEFESPGSDSVQSYISGMGTKISALQTIGKAIADTVIKALNDKKSEFETPGADAVQSYISGMGSKLAVVKSAATAVANEVERAFGEKKQSFVTLGQDMMLGLMQGIQNKATQVAQAAAQVSANALTAAKAAVDSNSPSKKFIELGGFMDEGLSIGLEKNAAMVNQSSIFVADGLVNAFRDTLGIHSASTEGKELGYWMDVGLAEGLENNTSSVTTAGEAVGATVTKSITNSIDVDAISVSGEEAVKALANAVTLDDLYSNMSVQGPLHLADALLWDRNVSESYAGLTDSAQKVIDKMREAATSVKSEIVASSDDITSTYMTKAEETWSKMGESNNKTVADELAYWQKLLATQKKGTEDYAAIALKVYELQTQQATAKIATWQAIIDAEKLQRDVSLSEEIAYWQKRIVNLDEGSALYKAAMDRLNALESELITQAEERLEKESSYRYMSLEQQRAYWEEFLLNEVNGEEAKKEIREKIAEITVEQGEEELEMIGKVHEMSLEEQKEYWKNYLETENLSVEQKQAIKAKIVELNSELSEDLVDGWIKRVEYEREYHGMSLEEEIAFWKKKLDSLKEGTETYKRVYAIYSQLVGEGNGYQASRIVKDAEQDLEIIKSVRDMTLKEERRYWKDLLENENLGVEEKRYIREKIRDLNLDIQDEEFDAMVSYVNDQIDLHDWDIDQEIAYWNEKLKKATEGTRLYKKIMAQLEKINKKSYKVERKKAKQERVSKRSSSSSSSSSSSVSKSSSRSSGSSTSAADKAAQKEQERQQKENERNQKIYNEAEKYMSRQQKLRTVDLEEQESYWNSKLLLLSASSDEYENIQDKLFELEVEQDEKRVEGYAATLDLRKKYDDISTDSELEYWRLRLGAAREGSREYYAIQEKIDEAEENRDARAKEVLTNQIADMKNLHEVSTEEELGYWEAIFKTMKDTSEAYFETEEKIEELKRTLAEEEVDAMANHIGTMKERYKTSVEDEIQYWQDMMNGVEYGSRKYYAILEKIDEAEKNRSDRVYELAEDYISEQKKYREMTTEEEMSIWKERMEAMESNSDAYFKASEQLKELQITLDEEAVEELANQVDLQKKYESMSIDDEIAYWKARLQEAEENSRKYYAIQEKLAEVETNRDERTYELAEENLEETKKVRTVSLKEEAKYWSKVKSQLSEYSDAYYEAADNIYDAQEQIVSDLTDLNEDFLEDVTDIKDNLVSDINDVWEEYDDAIKSRADSLENMTSLFEYFESDSYEDADSLLENLESQVAGIEKFEENINALMERGISDNLLEDLREMGPSANANLENLLSMTEDQWAQYLQLYEDRAAKATEIATNEIDATEYNERVKTLIQDAQTDLDELSASYKESLTDIGADLEDTTIEIGSLLADGLVIGIQEGKADVVAAAQNLADAAVASVQDVLDLHSPSRVFMWIGEMCDMGIVSGINNYSDVVKNASSGLGNTAVTAIQNSMMQLSDMDLGLNDYQPVIRPVLDLSDVQNGMSTLDGLMTDDLALDPAGLNAISAISSTRRNRSADEIQNGLSFKDLEKLVQDTADNSTTFNNEFNITGADPRETANEVSRILQLQVRSREAAWA